MNRRPGGTKAELGFSISRTWQGKGYASEAVLGVLGELFAHGLQTAVAECDERNRRSARLLEHLGFTFARQRSFVEREKQVHITISEFTLSVERWTTLERQ